MRLTVPVLQTKLTPCAECVVRCEKALLTFWRDVHKYMDTQAYCCAKSSVLWNTHLKLADSVSTRGWSAKRCTSQKMLKNSGISCLCRTHFRLSQQGVRGCTICRPQWDEAVKGWNELSMVGQSQEEEFWKDREVSTTVVGAYQTVPRLQDRTAERDWWISICFCLFRVSRFVALWSSRFGQ